LLFLLDARIGLIFIIGVIAELHVLLELFDRRFFVISQGDSADQIIYLLLSSKLEVNLSIELLYLIRRGANHIRNLQDSLIACFDRRGSAREGLVVTYGSAVIYLLFDVKILKFSYLQHDVVLIHAESFQIFIHDQAG
jgi:hypothetical protein